ncbi:MAG TPA: 16S rRNA (cytosine(1402)-N(4))-methyltransferase RsmH [Burkholderiaceae bacterium]|nr:16S rRNA (cytosine(1402)-N(4))-methyltransferase RsmH [Burkholderiaceae bacterium]
MEFVHRSVLLEPTVNALLDPAFGLRSTRKRSDRSAADSPPDRSHGIFVDGTFGRGGHSRLLLSRLSDDARLVVFDKDPVAIESARALERADSRVHVVHGGFASMVEALTGLGIDRIDGVMLDLGISSPQVDDAQRGFSFMREGPLDMRMDTSSGLTAAQWLAEADVEEIQEVIENYGEERFAFQIAKAVVDRRQSRPLRTTLDLAELVASVVRTREKGQHPATRTFQALRIHLNQELEELALALKAILKLLACGGRLAVISFHSLEDRMVKQCIAAAARPAAAQARLPIPEKDLPPPILISLGKVMPDEQEVRDNARARSAVLRVAQRTDAPLPADAGESFVARPALRRRAAQRRRR